MAHGDLRVLPSSSAPRMDSSALSRRRAAELASLRHRRPDAKVAAELPSRPKALLLHLLLQLPQKYRLDAAAVLPRFRLAQYFRWNLR
mmetsp:Transcript_93238/g.185049  ORF Transcript_93238/g.185049 Transcript_93238/m.185049 type:complete len:88 (-) Transcript_93238:135-398(-)